MELKKYKLGEIATVEISGVDKKTRENEIPVKLCNFTDVYNNWAITKEIAVLFMTATVTQKEFDIFSLKKGQVAFTKDSETRDDIGIPTYIADDLENIILGYHTALITPDKSKLSGKYLNAFMNTKYIQKFFENNACGSGQRYTISNESLKEMPILAPDLEIQKRIGNIFCNIDRKIALNQRINRILEDLARQIYDYWFVQFDFPDKNGKPYKTTGGKMVYNDQLKREIPEGWKNGKIGDLFESQAGYAFKSSDWKESGHPVLTIKNIQSDGSVDFDDVSYANCYKDGLAKYSVDNGNMIFAMSGNTIGKIGIIASSIKNVLINQRVLIIKTSTSNIAFPFLTIMNGKVQNLVFQLGANSAQPNISEDELRNIKICLPPEKLLYDFNKLFKYSFEEIINNRIESAKLTALRDRLLTFLMNGQVEVE